MKRQTTNDTRTNQLRLSDRLVCLAKSVVVFGLTVIVLIGATIGSTTPSRAQNGAELPPFDEELRRARVASQALLTLRLLTAERATLERSITDLERALSNATSAASRDEAQRALQERRAERDALVNQMSALTTGVAITEFNLTGNEKFDLETELNELLRPFLTMLKSATEDARQIERLRYERLVAEQNRQLAQRALARLEPLPRLTIYGEVDEALAALHADWSEKRADAEKQAETLDSQLASLLDAQASPTESAGNVATDFFANRGKNLALGLLAFATIFFGMRFVLQLATGFQERRGISRSFVTRLAALIWHALSFIVAIMAMLFVFNFFRDWLLLGITMIFLIAMGWLGIKMLPSLAEQVTLLLNLGAVQEGERVMLDGVPWLVKRLDLYTVLVNPELEGGQFELPIRALSGLRSRPAAQSEAWFPSRKGDWVKLQDGNFGKVIVQTPEMVQIVELGSSRVTYTTADFMAQTPRDLSTGFRVEVEFGIDYRHQEIATDEVIKLMRAHVQKGLLKIVDRDDLLNVDVEFLRAAPSSLDYEVEADLAGRAASEFETIEREMARLLVEACNTHGWVIPVPQMEVRGHLN